jgi:hypothetical protein
MNDTTRSIRQPGRAWPAPRAAAAVIATAGLAFLVCGCGGGGTSSTTSTASAQAGGELAFSACMRSHGVPTFPDPDSSGQIPKTKVVPLTGSPQFQVAQRACQRLLPNTNPPPSLTPRCRRR